ncbi:Diguanylate cyclase DosC [Thalassocella blandensis]|nr:Diguanylate cyclase DosC [Thalassocella blandensis]
MHGFHPHNQPINVIIGGNRKHSGLLHLKLTSLIRTLLLTLMIGCAVTVHALAPSQSSRFKSYLGEQGLNIGSVEAIIQDYQGFIWMGGTDGLARFNGYEFKTFRYQDMNSQSLSNNTVWAIFEDSKHNLWVGTEAGLNLFDRENQSFTRFVQSEDDRNSLPSNIIKSITEDSHGSLWIGTYWGMARFDVEQKRFTRFYHDPNNTNSLTSNLVRHIEIDHEGYVWISTEGGGLDQFDTEQNIFTHYVNQPGNPGSLPHNIVNEVYEDRQHQLWVGTDNGVSLLNRRTASFTHYLKAEEASPSSRNHVSAIHQDSYGNLWVGTDNGLFILESGQQDFSSIERDPLNPYSLTSNAIRDFCEDKAGDIWLGTFPEGVNFLDGNNMAFRTFSHNPIDKHSIRHSSILSLKQDNQNNLLIGTDGGGLNLVRYPDNKLITALEHDAEDSNTISSDSVLSIAVEKNDVIWAGTWGAGLNRIDLKNASVDRYFLDYQNDKTISNNNVWSLFLDRQQRLWAGTIGGGLNLYDETINGFHRFPHNPASAKSLSASLVWDIYQDKQDRLWFATGSGLNLLDENTNTFLHFAYPETHPNHLAINNMLTLHEDKQGYLWIGTRGAGLLRFNPEDGEFINYNSSNSDLINNMIVSIEEDAQANLWLGTNHGLVKFSPDNQEVFTFDQSNGIQGNQFNLDASLTLHNGELVFGGTKGYTLFAPADVKHNTLPPRIVFTDFQIFNKPVIIGAEDSPLQRAINYTSDITLNHKQSVFSFQYAALNYRHPNRNEYAYKLEGFDKDWNYVDDQRIATYTNLDSGTYTFTVIASNNDGVWNKQGKSITLHILPPPWFSWWAYTLYFMACLLLVALFFNAQRRKIEYEIELNRQLEKQVAERTKELEEKNSELKTAYTKLEDISQSDPLTGLYNRRYLYRFLPHDSSKVIRAYANWDNTRPQAKDSDLVFFLVDADHFKSVNDEFGHINGDRVLIQFSEILKQVCRESDCIVRWGGEEFLIVSRFTNREQAPAIAERIRRSVEHHIFQMDNGQTIQRTCSIGFACFPFNRSAPDSLTPEQTIDIADRCLYMVKKNQRNGWMGFYLADEQQDNIIALLDNPEKTIEKGWLGMQTSISKPLTWD